MTDNPQTENTMMRYLLGEMSEQERNVFEDQYLNDREAFDRLVEQENDLVDLYALGGLSEEERERLERSFLARPGGARRLAFATLLAGYPEKAPEISLLQTTKFASLRAWWRPLQSAILRFSALLVMIALLAGISWLALLNHRMKKEIQALRDQQADSSRRANTLQQQVDKLSVETEKRRMLDAEIAELDHVGVVSFALTADSLRGNLGAQQLMIPDTAAFVIFRLGFPSGSSPNYDLFLETAEGRQVWNKKDVPSMPSDHGNSRVAVALPSPILRSGDYIMRVVETGSHPNADLAGFSFRVKRR